MDRWIDREMMLYLPQQVAVLRLLHECLSFNFSISLEHRNGLSTISGPSMKTVTNVATRKKCCGSCIAKGLGLVGWLAGWIYLIVRRLIKFVDYLWLEITFNGIASSNDPLRTDCTVTCIQRHQRLLACSKQPHGSFLFSVCVTVCK